MNNKLKLSILLRNSLTANNKPNYCKILSRWYTENGKDRPRKIESTKVNDKKKEKSDEVKNKLNSLLKEMAQGPAKGLPVKPLNLAKPESKQADKITKTAEKESKETVVKVVKEVAESLGGNTKQTESELMKKLLNNNEEDKLDTISSLSEIFKGMKIDRRQPKEEKQTRSQQVREILARTERQQERRFPEQRVRIRPQSLRKSQVLKLDNVNLFASDPLGIFTLDPSEYTEGVKNTTWDKLNQREKNLAVTHPPSNYFQQMILWTEQEKLWKFPIDNEQGLEDEQNVYFAEHVFLEKHLEPWCPQKGPIRHFMELVCVGLSKNPYLTVDAKREHIEWYRNYFEDKRQLLKEVGASLNEIKHDKEIESK